MYVVDLGDKSVSLKSYAEFSEFHKALLETGFTFDFPGRGDARGPAVEFRRRRFDILVKMAAAGRGDLLERWLATSTEQAFPAPAKTQAWSPTSRLNAALLGSTAKIVTLTRAHPLYRLKVECDGCGFVASQPYRVFRAANNFFCEFAPRDVARLYDTPSLEDWCEISFLVALEHLSRENQHKFLSYFEFEDDDDDTATHGLTRALLDSFDSFEVTVGTEEITGYFWARIALDRNCLSRTFFAEPREFEEFPTFSESAQGERCARLQQGLTLFLDGKNVVSEQREKIFDSLQNIFQSETVSRRKTFDTPSQAKQEEALEIRFALEEVFGLEDECYDDDSATTFFEKLLGIVSTPPDISVVATIGSDQQISKASTRSFDPCWAPPAVATFNLPPGAKSEFLLLEVYDRDSLLGHAVVNDLDRVAERKVNCRIIDCENLTTSARVSGSLSIRREASVSRSEDDAVRQHCVLVYQKCSRRRSLFSSATTTRSRAPTTLPDSSSCCSTDALASCRHAALTTATKGGMVCPASSPSCCDNVDDARDLRATWIPCGSYVPTDAMRPYDDDVQTREVVDLPLGLDELLPLSQGEYIVEEWHQARRKDSSENAYSFVQYAPTLQSKVWTTHPTSSSTYRRTVFFRLTTRDPAVRRPFARISTVADSSSSSPTEVYKVRRRRVNGNPGRDDPLRARITGTYGDPPRKKKGAERDMKKAFAATRAAAILDASNFPYIIG